MPHSTVQYSLFGRSAAAVGPMSSPPSVEQLALLNLQRRERLLGHADDLLLDLHHAVIDGETTTMRSVLHRLDRLALDLGGGNWSGLLADGGAKRAMLDRWRPMDGIEPRWGAPGRFTMTIQRVTCDVRLPDGPFWGDVELYPVHWELPFYRTVRPGPCGRVILRDFTVRVRLEAPGCSLVDALRDTVDDLWHRGKLVLSPLDRPPDRSGDAAWAVSGHLGMLAPRWAVLDRSDFDVLASAS